MTTLVIPTGPDEGLVRRQLAPACNEVTDAELALYLGWCGRYGLDPLAGQTYALRTGGRFGWSATIGGLRVLAERTGEYEGQDGPWWCGADGAWRDVWLDPERRPPFACRVGVWRTGFRAPLWGTAKWASWHKTPQRGAGPWQTMPDHMLAVRAEAVALRRPFPGACALAFGDEADAYDRRRRHVLALCHAAGLDDSQRHQLIEAATDGQTDSSKALSAAQAAEVVARIEEL